MIWRRLRRSPAMLSFAGMVATSHPLSPSWHLVPDPRFPIMRLLSHSLLSLSAYCSSTFSDHRINLGDLFGNKKYCFSSQAWVEPPAGTTVEVPLAQTGEGIAECEVLKWFVQEGDEIEAFQALCEIQSDKATMEITSRYKGKVHQIMYVPGDIVKVGEILLKLYVDELQTPNSSSDAVDVENLNLKTKETNDQTPCITDGNMGKVLSTPPVCLLANQYGVDINETRGQEKMVGF